MRTSTMILQTIAMLALHAPFTTAAGQEPTLRERQTPEVGVSPWGPEDHLPDLAAHSIVASERSRGAHRQFP